MRTRTGRHLHGFFESARAGAPIREDLLRGTQQHGKSPELTWRDYLILLLYIAAEIEHSLMVQYLFAAYSLGGPQVPTEKCAHVRRWQREVLAVAKEEMGHLLSIQNVLCLLGAPVSLDREDYPWDSQFYPFPFRLEPLTRGSLACYVYAEMPSHPDGGGHVITKGELDEIRREVHQHLNAHGKRSSPKRALPSDTEHAHHVGTLYDDIIEILQDRTKIPDADLRSETFPAQAAWDEWGRGYAPDPVPAAGEDEASSRATARRTAPKAAASQDVSICDPARPFVDAHVIVDRIATRTQAVDLLTTIAKQGEAPHLRDGKAIGESHFNRFLALYRSFKQAVDDGWRPTWNVAANPTTDDAAEEKGASRISAEPSRTWASWFNVRYRMLLTYLTHLFRLMRATGAEQANVRGATMQRVFLEMYNLKTIAGILVQLPLNGNRSAMLHAGPPFQMPYTLTLPVSELDCWHLHQDLLLASRDIGRDLLAGKSARHESYVKALLDADQQSLAWIGSMLGSAAASRYTG